MKEISSKVKEGGLSARSPKDEFAPYWVWCFECGAKFLVNSHREQVRYESTGVCPSCELLVLSQNDPILGCLEKINENIEDVLEEIININRRMK